MAIPLKNGADLYNFEVLRMRFHNLGADPTSDFGVGQVYFNTSTSEGSGKRVRIYDGSAFRSLAYFDEIDNRLKLLEGEIDTDAIISNMKEVSAFLEGFEEDASLMDVLNGKLDKTASITQTITTGQNTALDIKGSGSVTESGIRFSMPTKNGAWMGYGDGVGAYMYNYAANKALGIKDDGTPYFGDNTILHSGNVGEYALKKGAGGNRLDIETPLASNEAGFHAYFQRISTDGTNVSSSDIGSARKGVIRLAGGNSESQLLFDHYNGQMHYRNYGSSSWSAWKTIAFTDSNVASATKLETARTIWGQSFDGTGNIEGNIQNVTLIRFKDSGIYGIYRGVNYSDNLTANDLAYVSIKHAFYTSGYQRLFINQDGNVTIGASDLAGTTYKLFVDGKLGMRNGTNASVVLAHENDALYLGYSNVSSYDTIVSGKNVLLMPSGGSVLIGTTTDNDEKLHVKGNVRATEIFVGTESQRYGRFTWASSGTADLVAESGNVLRLGVGSTRSMRIETDGLINLLTDTTITGDLHVTGNIIADGEVSAGGAGEEGDTGTGTGGGDALIYSQEFTPTTTSITITHNLSATKGVIVQVWEKNGNYWDMVLVDVEEVDTNTVTLFFGKTETTVHKVVIMG